jgi:hypothetical protein
MAHTGTSQNSAFPKMGTKQYVATKIAEPTFKSLSYIE